MTDFEIVEFCFNRTGIDSSQLATTPEYLKVVGYISLVFCLLYFPFCLIIFFYFRNKSDNKYLLLRKRNPFVLIILNLTSMGISSLYAAVNMIGNENFSCLIFLGFISSLFSILLSTYFCRVLSFYFRVKFNQNLINSKYQEIERTVRAKSIAIDNVEGQDILKRCEEGEEIKPQSHRYKQQEDKIDYTFAIFDFNDSTSENETPSKRQRVHFMTSFSFKARLMKLFCWTREPQLPEEVQFSFFLSSAKFINTILTLLMILSVLLGFKIINSRYVEINLNNLKCTGCAPSADNEEIGNFYLATITITLLSIFFLIILRKIPDGLGVKEEIYIFAIFLVFFNLLFVVIPRFFLFSEFESERKFDFSFITIFEFIIVASHSTIYQVFKIYKRDKNQKLTLDTSIEHILSTPEGTKAYAMFLSSLLAIEHLIFYKTIEKWEAFYDAMTIKKRETVGNLILLTFFDDKSDMACNFSWTMKKDIRERIMAQDFSRDMFEVTKHEALELVQNELLPFTRSYYYSTLDNGAVALGNQLA